MATINVFIVDDSAVVRQVLTEVLNACAGVRVLGSASDPIFAEKKMQAQWPDVIVLDIEMPRMDGITFLRKLMAERPTPVVICSTLTAHGATTSMQAMSAGAVDIITKPKTGLKGFLQESRTLLLDAIKGAAAARPKTAPKRSTAPTTAPAAVAPMHETTDRVVALGTSTGGTQALEQVLTALPMDCPGIVVVQHMPAQFTRAFAERLDGLCKVRVKEAEAGDRVVPGHVLIAPGGQHMTLLRSGAQYRVEVKDGPLVSRHRPSVDVLFRSVAQAAGKNALGVIMTGMGDDGARGLLEMYQAGALTLGQDEASCVVYGMPKEALRMGGVMRQLALEQIASAICHPQSWL
ncbi:chemotaxis response regulator protein-glutamate methylesterase [Bacterioplanes sanyensis]|uniref:Protein-glutamate methylesterase/protein-glutamine glutaminase n=1 Tax=Bacterioplanes sanyensis TaxID=1249553 RepID=A0A222FPI7_9GAMM|nr:chemotaxis response regulator protein-glutamate methylesterase [Bacterioplanes sanyensis]ASP40917.1 chemotaxis response regulator protein-glutamate methylesterase [Bacterioplanes sanyensis]